MFDLVPSQPSSQPHPASGGGVNFLERLWAYLTIQNLLEKVARGELNSCSEEDFALQEEARGAIAAARRRKRSAEGKEAGSPVAWRR